MEVVIYYLADRELININRTNKYLNLITGNQEFWLNKFDMYLIKPQTSFYSWIKLYQTSIYYKAYAKTLLRFIKPAEFLINPDKKLRLQPIPDFILSKMTFVFNPDDVSCFHFRFDS